MRRFQEILKRARLVPIWLIFSCQEFIKTFNILIDLFTTSPWHAKKEMCEISPFPRANSLTLTHSCARQKVRSRTWLTHHSKEENKKLFILNCHCHDNVTGEASITRRAIRDAPRDNATFQDAIDKTSAAGTRPDSTTPCSSFQDICIE